MKPPNAPQTSSPLDLAISGDGFFVTRLLPQAGRAHAERLQNAPLNFGGQHGLAQSDGYGCIGEGELTIFRRHEGFARHGGQRIQHARVEDFPGAYLLIHHLVASGQSIHAFSR